VQLLKFLLH
jgi:hypothetical protein